MIFYNVTYYDGDDRVVNGLDLATRLGSPDLASYWPNVVQFVFFTVYSDFGMTMQYAFQGMAGTMWAELNIFFLLQLLPHGGKCDSGIVEGHLGLKPSCDEYGYANPDSEQWRWILYIVNNVCVTALIFVFNIGLPVKMVFVLGLRFHDAVWQYGRNGTIALCVVDHNLPLCVGPRFHVATDEDAGIG